MKFSDFQVGDYVTFNATITPSQFEAFSALSGDRNRLHWDESVGAASSFGRTLVPLLLAVAPFSAVAGMALPGEPSLILQQSFDAVNPIRYGAALTYSARVERCVAAQRALVLSLRVMAGDEVAIRGQMTTQCRAEQWSPPADGDPRFLVRRVPRLALVTGAAGAIGAATVRALAAANWDVWPVTRTAAPVLRADDPYAARVRPAWAADLADPDDLKRLAQALATEPPSLIVHCASAPYRSPVGDLVATNFAALEGLAAACVPAFLARQAGRIVFVGSLAQRTHGRQAMVYGAAKEMAAHLLDGLNHRYGSSGVAAMTLMPDLVRSSFGAGLSSASGLRLEPEEVAQAIVDLTELSHPAGRYTLDHHGLRRVDDVALPWSPDATGPPTGQRRPNADATPVVADTLGTLRDRLRAVFLQVMPTSAALSDEALRLGEVASWDSLEHIKLMIEVERYFSVNLGTHDISDVTSFADILKLLQSQLATP